MKLAIAVLLMGAALSGLAVLGAVTLAGILIDLFEQLRVL